MRLLPLPLVLTALVAALAFLPHPASASKKRCRQCTCTLTFSGNYKPNELDLLMYDKVTREYTGGGGFSWQVAPAPSSAPGSAPRPPPAALVGAKPKKGAQSQTKSHVGTATFPRLCGTAKSVAKKTSAYTYWTGGATWVDLVCDGCGTHVKCKEGSVCQDSGIMGP